MRADLHIHTCLSPCADVSMTPDVFVEILETKNIDVVAITDHNSSLNVRPFKEYLEKHGFKVVPGIEVTSIEEVHVLGYFEGVEDAEELSREIYKHLPDMEFDPERFGYQILVDGDGNFIALEEKPLFLATDLSVDDVVSLIRKHNGIPVFAHVDRTFGVEYQLGMIPEGMEVDIVEVRKRETFERYRRTHHVLTSSDAHIPDEIGSRYIEFEKDLFEAFENGNFKNIFEIL